jgi:primosomal protein N' (replication factor Y)
MLAKGHHFPNVTLVAVLDADNGLFSPDFRGQESMIQLLFQVAGRAGRAEKPGQVVVQTRHATHASLQALVDSNYHDIAELLFKERKVAAMPPFSHLAVIRAEAPDMRLPLQFLGQAQRLCMDLINRGSMSSLVLHQPLPAPMEKRAGKYRAQMLLQSHSRAELQSLLTIASPEIESLKAARTTRWSIDVDPIDLI